MIRSLWPAHLSVDGFGYGFRHRRAQRRKHRFSARARKRSGIEGVSGRQLRQSAQLYPVGVDIDGRELSRVGEVIELAERAVASAISDTKVALTSRSAQYPNDSYILRGGGHFGDRTPRRKRKTCRAARLGSACVSGCA